MKCIATTIIALAALAAASPALAFEITDHKTGITTSVDHSDYGVSLSNNAVGKLVGNSRVYGFATVGYGSDHQNLDASQDSAISQQNANALLGVVGISYRF